MDTKLSDGWNKMLDKLGSWLDGLVMMLPNFVIAVLVFIVVVIISKYISSFTKKLLGRTKLQDSMRNLIARMVSVIIILLGLFLVLGILNLSKTLNTILAGAGVVGLAVGLALQGALANTYSGIILSYVKYIKLGDWIESNGFSGEVKEIDLRSVTLRQPDNNMVYIPNKLVVENPIKNFSSTSQSRVIFHCGVGYEDDLEFVRELTKKTIAETFDAVDQEDVIFLYTEFGDSSINYECRFWIDSTKALEIHKARTEAMIAIKKAYDSNGINIPFPIRTLDLPDALTIHRKDGGSQESTGA